MEKELAEFCGIVAGDGHVDKNNSQITITGHPTNDLEYFNFHLIPLIKRLFNKSPKLEDYGSFIRVRVNSKDSCNLLNKLGFPSGEKGDKLVFPTKIQK